MKAEKMNRGALFQALERQISLKRSRFHMPGHKGKLDYPLSCAAEYDFTELPLTDSLYEAEGAIAELEAGFTDVYGSGRTFLSAGGSTLGIQTMISLIGKGKRIVCDRNIHTSAQNAFGLLDDTPIWVKGSFDRYGIYVPPTAEDFEKTLSECGGCDAVYVTSPNYFGRIADIEGISRVAHKYGVPLIVDNAHGSHLIIYDGLHPIQLGADVCADSLHKNLPSLTGAALLHFSKKSMVSHESVKRNMSWFGSTSPNYLIMLSAEQSYEKLCDSEYIKETLRLSERLDALRKSEAAKKAGVIDGKINPLNVSFPIPDGMSAEELRGRFYESGIEPELCNGMGAVLLISPANSEEDIARLEKFISELPPKLEEKNVELTVPRRIMSIREAMFSPSKPVKLESAAGKIAASAVCPCPPGIPVAMAGEKFDSESVALLKSLGVNDVSVKDI